MVFSVGIRINQRNLSSPREFQSEQQRGSGLTNPFFGANEDDWACACPPPFAIPDSYQVAIW